MSRARSRNLYQTLAICGLISGGVNLASAEIASWAANSGLRPEQLSSYWQLNTSGVNTSTVVSNNLMTLRTTSRTSYDFYTFGPEGIQMPTALTIEFGARFVSSVAAETTFSPMMVYFCLGNGLGSALYLGADDLWLAAPNLSRGVSASADTDNFLHTYRIEVSGMSAGSSVNVFYDNSVSPLLSSILVNDMSVYGNTPQIGFGDKSRKDSGQSEWAFLWHNAACVPITPVPEPTVASLLLASLALWAKRNGTKK